jgi:hypothetical protein
MRFAKWVFLLAGTSGVLMIVPPFFLEAQTGRDLPPAINHPEYYYGFFGVTLAWQFLFIVIGLDPIRHRLTMLPAFVEKGSFAIAIPILFVFSRVDAIWLAFAAMDTIWLILFVISFIMTTKTPTQER